MVNPWVDLPSAAPYVLPEDRPRIEAFNATLSPASLQRINFTTVIPEPFIGAVNTAPVVVLQLNPGLDQKEDPSSHADPQFRRALFANLRHEGNEWPFYFSDPQFRDSTSGGIWWKKRTKKLAEAIRVEDLGHRLAIVEWFPYKSTKYKAGCTVGSQEYGFSLLSHRPLTVEL